MDELCLLPDNTLPSWGLLGAEAPRWMTLQGLPLALQQVRVSASLLHNVLCSEVYCSEHCWSGVPPAGINLCVVPGLKLSLSVSPFFGTSLNLHEWFECRQDFLMGPHKQEACFQATKHPVGFKELGMTVDFSSPCLYFLGL